MYEDLFAVLHWKPDHRVGDHDCLIRAVYSVKHEIRDGEIEGDPRDHDGLDSFVAQERVELGSSHRAEAVIPREDDIVSA
jgi:hypothetical protein